MKLRLRAQEQEFSRQRDLNAYKTIRESLKGSGQLNVCMCVRACANVFPLSPPL